MNIKIKWLTQWKENYNLKIIKWNLKFYTVLKNADIFEINIGKVNN